MPENLKPKVKVEYAFSSEQPSMNDSIWNALEEEADKEDEILNVKQNQTFWVRAASESDEGLLNKWVVYGPLIGDNQDIDVNLIKEQWPDDVIQIRTERNNEKGLRCCRIRVRVRVVVRKPPRIEVRNPLPEVTVRWRGPIPSVTVKGPDIVISDLPQLPNMEIESPIPDHSIPQNVGMFCEALDNDTKMYIQNDEPKSVDVWIMYNGINAGPSRIEAKTMRSIGKTGHANCEIANKNIYIVRAEFVGGW